MRKSLDCGGRRLSLERPRVMGVLNITSDSFSDGGQWLDPRRAVERAQQMVTEGAAIIDIGGESTRPGAQAVSVDEELRRVIPVIEELTARLDVPLSVDTSKPEVMTAAVAAGAGLINDVRALREPGALEAAAACGVPVCLMHMQGSPANMQDAPRYDNVLEEVSWFFSQRVSAAREAGIKRKQLLLDPGFGFGKTQRHNLALLTHLRVFEDFDLPLVVGISRKSMLGEITGAAVDKRLPAGLAAACIAALQGARIIRSHDVAATVQAMQVCDAVLRQ